MSDDIFVETNGSHLHIENLNDTVSVTCPYILIEVRSTK